MKLIKILIFLLTVNNALACDCHPPENGKRYQEFLVGQFNYSDVVLLVSVENVSKEEKLLDVRIIETFKGDFSFNQELKVAFPSNCTIFPESETCTWLIFANNVEEKLEINICAGSRSIKKPNRNPHFMELLKMELIHQGLDSIKFNPNPNLEGKYISEKAVLYSIKQTELDLKFLRNLK